MYVNFTLLAQRRIVAEAVRNGRPGDAHVTHRQSRVPRRDDVTVSLCVAAVAQKRLIILTPHMRSGIADEADGVCHDESS